MLPFRKFAINWTINKIKMTKYKESNIEKYIQLVNFLIQFIEKWFIRFKNAWENCTRTYTLKYSIFCNRGLDEHERKECFWHCRIIISDNHCYVYNSQGIKYWWSSKGYPIRNNAPHSPKKCLNFMVTLQCYDAFFKTVCSV